MKKGGYQILDLKGQELSTMTSLSGAYLTIDQAHGKPILVSGIRLLGGYMNDVFVTPLFDEDLNAYVIELYNYKLIIVDDDSISLESKIIELANAYSIISDDVEEIVENGLYKVTLNLEDLGVSINSTKVKRIFSISDGGYWYPYTCSEPGIISFLTTFNPTNETIGEIELY